MAVAPEPEAEPRPEPLAEPPSATEPAVETPAPPELAVEPMAEAPAEPQPVAAAAPGPSRGDLMLESALLVRDLLWGSRDGRNLAQDLPAFAPAEIGFLLYAIAARMPIEPADQTTLPATLAAEAASQGLHISAREVTAVLRWLGRGYAKLAEPATPDGAARLGQVLYATLVAAVRAVGEQLSEAEKDALRGWSQGEISEG